MLEVRGLQNIPYICVGQERAGVRSYEGPRVRVKTERETGERRATVARLAPRASRLETPMLRKNIRPFFILSGTL